MVMRGTRSGEATEVLGLNSMPPPSVESAYGWRFRSQGGLDVARIARRASLVRYFCFDNRCQRSNVIGATDEGINDAIAPRKLFR